MGTQTEMTQIQYLKQLKRKFRAIYLINSNFHVDMCSK